jgi:FkbM family methyltransferase
VTPISPHHLVRRALDVIGLPIGKKTAHSDLRWYLRALLPRLGINCVIDVGAHHGDFGRFLRDIGFEGRMVSFEPMGESFGRLSAAASGDADWKVRQLGLGDERQEALLHVFQTTQFNSLLTLTPEGAGRWGSLVEERRTETIEVRTLDEVFDACIAGISTPRVYLKIDTQGYDQRVIAGGARSLARITALQTELSVSSLYQDAPSMTDALSHVQSLGFAPTAFFPVSFEADGVHVFEFDCVMVRKPLPTTSPG